MERPHDHHENRLFLRLVDELSTPAHKVLAALDHEFTPQERRTGDRDVVLSDRTGVPRDRVGEALSELERAGLVDPARLNGPDPSSRSRPSLDTVGVPEGTGTAGVRSYEYMATRLGAEFVAFRRGTTDE